MNRQTETLTPSPGGVESPAASDARAAPADEAERLAPGACVGRYTVRELVGEGGMGRVYAASDPELGRTVALKLLRSEVGGGSDERRTRFLREARAMARLVHPNVVTVHDVGTHDGQVFLAMELIDGDTLAGWLGGDRRRPWREIRDAFLAAGRGLAAAHEAGIVHRDFKPHNVLVGGGRVVVADFGLARAEGPDPDATAGAPPTDGDLLGAPLTAAGRLVGTPGYVAPEVVAGLPATARSDQYSFCVALAAALRDAAGAPRFLAAAVARGLARDPADRHPSMRSLLAVLARDPARTARRGALAVAALAVVGAGGYAVAVARADSAAVSCAAGGERLAGAWSEARRDKLARAFLATGVPYASTVSRRLQTLLDGYAAEWTAARRDACRATHVRHEQSQALLALRLSCLDRRAADLGALTDALAGPLDRSVVDQALPAAERLPRIHDCSDVAQLQAVVPLPADVTERARAEAGLVAMAQVDALYRLGRATAAKARLDSAGNEVRGLAYAPLESDLAFWRGFLAYRLGPEEMAEAPIAESVRLAVRARDAVREARAWRGLFVILATYPDRIAEAEQVLRAAETALERSGGAAHDAGILGNSVARMYLNAGRFDEAGARLTRLVAELPESDAWNRGTALELQARLLVLTSRDAEAVRVAEAAVAMWERELGPDNSRIVPALNTLAGALDHLARGDEAEQAAQRALRIQLEAVGPASVDLERTLVRLAWLAAGRRDARATRDHVARLLGVVEPTAKADPVRWRNSLAQAGGALALAGLSAEAVPLLRRALEASQAAGDARRAAIASRYLGEALNDLGQPREALERCTDAQEPMGKLYDAEMRATALVCRGKALLLLGRPAEAATVLEEALASAPKATPGDKLETRARLAEALWAAGHDRSRALLVAAEGADEARGTPGLERQLADLEAWQRGKRAR